MNFCARISLTLNYVMASIKVKFRPSGTVGREGTVYYQIIHERKPQQLLTDYRIFPSEWDEKHSAVIVSGNSERRQFILSVREQIRTDVERLTKIIRRLDRSGIKYASDDVTNEFARYTREYSLSSFMESIILKLRQNGKVRTSETYTATLKSFRKFLESRAPEHGFLQNDDDIMLDCLDSDIMEAYEAWHKNRGNSPNTTSFYLRILRAVYNRAVECEIIENRSPFRHVYTGVDKTVKRALPLSVIKEIKELNLSCSPSMDFARDMFIMSFMLRGMSFIDMAFLRKTDLADGHIAYRRRKTGQRLTIEWTADMQMILDKYPENSSDYLLPIIRKRGTNERYAYRNAGYNINHNLKTIAKKIGITGSLTLYVARHSWASAAKAKGIPVSVISEGLGHDSETTTRIYLASLDTSVVDRANSIILKSII